MSDRETEQITAKCPYCGGDIVTTWVKGGGMLSDPATVLVADWVFHAPCWDKQIEEHPPG